MLVCSTLCLRHVKTYPLCPVYRRNDQLQYIIAIANTGSLSLAARQIGVSQPALSKYLNKLEQELGLTLFTREKKKLRPTEAGRVYINGACKILSRREEGLYAIRARTQGEKPQVLRKG